MTESSDVPQASSTSSEADADHDGASAAPDDQLAGVSDEQLPEDLQPGEDNPLAEPLDPDDESTKDADELGMDETQDDTPGTYESTGPTPSTSEEPEAPDTESAASASSAAQEPSDD